MRTELHLLALGATVLALAPATADADSCIPGFDYAAFAKNSIQIQGNAGTDSYDSSVGSYATTKACSDGDLGTNATAGGKVHVQSNSTQVCGDVAVGAGGNPNVVITGNGNIIGTRSAQAANKALPAVAFPALGNAANQNPSFQNQHATLAANLTYQSVSCKNGSLSLGAGKYIVKDLQLQANCELRVTSGPIEIYFTDNLQLQAGVVVNSSLVASNLIFFGGPTASNVQVQGGTSAAFAVYAPETQCQIQGNADVYGALVCEDVQIQGNAFVHYDRALANVGAGGFTCPVTEVARSTPIVTTLANQSVVVQGTYERPTASKKSITSVADIAGFEFPYIQGHLRARTAASFSTTGSKFDAGTILFDAGATGKIPPVSTAGCATFTGSCRQVFTNTNTPAANGTTRFPARVALTDGNASTIGALIAPTTAVPGITATHWQTIVRRVLAGRSAGTVSQLGGVDRSTVAVIGPSTLANATTRPTIAYVGATDGMLHAICASTGGSTPTQSNICPSLGTELWAFLPRVQLPLVRTNTTRLDGSVHVVDVFGDFDNPQAGKRSFRTIAVFQTGFSDAQATTPAAYALDVTDPADPRIVWEYVPPASKGSFELGVGLASAAGTVLVAGKATPLAVLATSNGGTAGTGVVATAVSLETGAAVWKFGHTYPSPPRGVAADAPMPALGVPGGAVGVDLAGSGFVTDLVLADLYGSVWRLAADTGASRTGADTPLFRFTANKRPIGAVPAIYSDGTSQYAAFASGAYVDPSAATWTSTTGQRLIGIKLTAPGPYPLTESSGALAINQSLATGDKAIAQALVVGTKLFLTTDTSDVNSSAYGTGGATGKVLTYDLVTQATSTTFVQGGASSLAASTTGALYSASSDKQQQLATSATPGGATVDGFTTPRLTRRLWLAGQ